MMIPASYLYKDIYRQTWLDPDPKPATEIDNASRGGGHPIRHGLADLLIRAADLLRRPRPASLASAPR